MELVTDERTSVERRLFSVECQIQMHNWEMMSLQPICCIIYLDSLYHSTPPFQWFWLFLWSLILSHWTLFCLVQPDYFLWWFHLFFCTVIHSCRTWYVLETIVSNGSRLPGCGAGLYPTRSTGSGSEPTLNPTWSYFLGPNQDSPCYPARFSQVSSTFSLIFDRPL
jgi:hypothetical protein